MIIGIPREIKVDEYRVALLPVGAELLVAEGHQVLIETEAGVGSGYDDAQYQNVGATIIEDPGEIFARADIIVKVKEPIGPEFTMMRRGQIIFTYFHFAANRELTEACLRAGIIAIAYETLTDSAGNLPLLKPMSEVAGPHVNSGRR